MTADIDLLPLPRSWDCWIANKMEDYARANVEHHTAELQAEIEALKSDLGDYMDAANYQAARAERLAEAINAVLADMSEWGEPAKGAHILRVINFLSMALHPTATQEGE